MEENISSVKSSLAGFFKRGFSVFVDLILNLIIFLILNLQFSVSASWDYSSGVGWVTSVEYQYPLNALFFLIVLIIYFTLTESLWGASVGKFIFRERVVGLSKEKISFSKSFLRNVFTPIDLILGPVFFLFSSKNQTLGDKIANTVVINKKLAELPIADKPISVVRKIFAILSIAMMIMFSILTLWTIPEISNLNKTSQVIIGNIKKESSGDKMSLYNSFAPEFRESVSFEKFELTLDSPEFRDMLISLDVNKIIFYNWLYNKDQAMVIGKQNNILVRISFVKIDIGEWKLLEFRLVPVVENISLLDFFIR